MANKKSRKSAGSTATIAEVIESKQSNENSKVDVPSESTESSPVTLNSEHTTAIVLKDGVTVESLKTGARDEFSKRNDSLNNFYAKLPMGIVGEIRKETKALISDLHKAGVAVNSAAFRIYNVRKSIFGFETEQSKAEELYMQFENALISEGHVSKGNAYVLRMKAEVFDTLSLNASQQNALMAYSNGGESIVVREPLTEVDRTAWKALHPTLKAPKGKYVASRFFVHACAIVEPPAKWTDASAAQWAGETLRLAAKLRGQARSGAQVGGDDLKQQRFAVKVDALTEAIQGKTNDKGNIVGMFVLDNKDTQNEILSDCATDVVACILKRLPLDAANELYESIDELFTTHIQSEKDRAEKHSKAATKAA